MMNQNSQKLGQFIAQSAQPVGRSFPKSSNCKTHAVSLNSYTWNCKSNPNKTTTVDLVVTNLGTMIEKGLWLVKRQHSTCYPSKQ